jgi:hypothetical protein
MNGSRVLAVQVRRAADLPGVEIRKVDRWSEQWRCYCRGFEFAVSQAWSGEVFLRGFRGEVRRGSVVACYPGEVYTTPKLHRAGSGYAVTIDADTLLQHLAAHGIAKTDLTLRRISKPSSRLARSLTRLLDAFDAEATPVQTPLRAAAACVPVVRADRIRSARSLVGRVGGHGRRGVRLCRSEPLLPPLQAHRRPDAGGVRCDALTRAQGADTS